MFWEEAPDVQHRVVKNAMPRNRFVAILQNLHFCDNTTIDTADKCGEVCPLLDMVRDNLRKHAKLTKCLNIDQSMIPYYGKFGQTLKQRMPLKPIQSGYKIWCLNLQGGYLYDFEVYQGKGSKNEFSDKFGLCPSVVLRLLKSLRPGQFCVYIDNYFNSIPLLKHLKQEGIGCTGTLRANMLQDCPLVSKAVFKKEKQGCYKGYIDEESEVIVAMWNDNGPVTVGFNFEATEPLGTARRWSNEDKDYIGVPRPAMIGSYNKAMGGTDQMDQAISTCRPFVRNRKW